MVRIAIDANTILVLPVSAMKLADFLTARNISAPEFGRRIGVSGETVRRYCQGMRTPRRVQMALIKTATEGQVTPNDFVDLPVLQAPDVEDANHARAEAQPQAAE